MKINFRLPLDVKEKVKINMSQIDIHTKKLPKIWFLRSRKKEEQFLERISTHINRLNELRLKYPCGEFTALYNSAFNKIDALNLKNPPKRIENIDKSSTAFNTIGNKVERSKEISEDISNIIGSKEYLKEHQNIDLKELNEISANCKNNKNQIEEMSKECQEKIDTIRKKPKLSAELTKKINEIMTKLNQEKETTINSMDKLGGVVNETKSNIFKTDRICSMANNLDKTVNMLKSNCENGQVYSTELMSSSSGVLNMARNTKQEIEKELDFLDKVVGGKQLKYNHLDSLTDNASKSIEYFKNKQKQILNELSLIDNNIIDKD